MISILSSPQLIQPVYNPIFLKVSSDETTKEAYSFIFDLYVNGIFVNRDRLLPRPASTEAVYSPARILESYLSFDKSQNTIGSTASTNTILDYEVRVGEEWIQYWIFNSKSAVTGTYSAYTRFNSSGNTNAFNAGDQVYIQQYSGYTYAGYNGVFKVLSASTTSIVVDLPYASASTNGGTIVYSDKRKTEYTSLELLPDPNFNTQAYWSTYGADASNNSISLNGAGQLNWQQYSASTFLTKYSEALSFDLVSGVTYTVTYEVYDKYPATGTAQTTYVTLGGTSGATNNGVGVFTEDITCGAGTKFRIYGASTGSGLRGITFDSVSIKLSSVKGYAFNGVLQYEEIPSWDYTDYKLINSSGKFLTNQPSTVSASIDERGDISFMWLKEPISSYTYSLYVSVTNNSNATTNYTLPLSGLNLSLTTDRMIQHVGVYPWNINQKLPNTINSNTKRYKVQIIQFDGETFTFDISEIKTFEIDTKCSKYEPVRFMFLNTLGAFDYFTATLLSRETLSITKTNYQKTLASDYVQGDRGRTVLGLEAQQSYMVNTDWIDESTLLWLQEMVLSTEVYVINSDGSLMPVIIDMTSFEPKKRVNNGLFNQVFIFSKAVTKNTARG